MCLKIASRGDLLLAAPAFQWLRRSIPRAHITLVVGASCEEVARHLPFFDEIRAVDDRALMAGGLVGKIRGAAALSALMACGGASPLFSFFKPFKKEGGYSKIFIFHRDWRYALLAWLARIPGRHGFRTGASCWFLTSAHAPGKDEHHARQYLGMVGCETDGSTGETPVGGGSAGAAAVQGLSLKGVWRFQPGERERGLAAAVGHGYRAGTANSVALAFGGGRNVKTRTGLKCWPIEHFRSLAERLAASGRQVVWLGDAEDSRALGNVATGIHLAGKLSEGETAAVLGDCSLAVANDSFLLHLAGALGVRCIGIFGPTNPFHYRPLSGNSSFLWLGDHLPCSPCHRDGYFPPCRHEHRCMRDLDVDSVAREIEGVK